MLASAQGAGTMRTSVKVNVPIGGTAPFIASGCVTMRVMTPRGTVTAA